MYKLSNRREMTIEKDGIAVKQPLGTVVLPVSCWKTLLEYMPDIDDLIPSLRQGLKVSYQKRLGSGWIVKVTQCYQCIVIRREEWKKEKDHRQVLLIVGTEWTIIHDILPLILAAAEEKVRPRFPTYSYIDPDDRYIPDLTIINGENDLEVAETKDELGFLRIPTSNTATITTAENG